MKHNNPLDYLLKKIFDKIAEYIQSRPTSICGTDWRAPSEIIIRDKNVFYYLVCAADSRKDERVSLRRSADGTQPQLYLWRFPATYIPAKICTKVSDSAVVIPPGFWPFEEGEIC